MSIRLELPIPDPNVRSFVEGFMAFMTKDAEQLGWEPPEAITEDKREVTSLGTFRSAENKVVTHVQNLMMHVNAFYAKGAPGRKEFLACFLTSIIGHELSHAKHLRKEFPKAINQGWEPGNPRFEVFGAVPKIPQQVRRDVVSIPIGFFPLGHRAELAGTPLGTKIEMRKDYLAGISGTNYTDKGEAVGFPGKPFQEVLYAGEFVTHMGMLHELLGYAEELTGKDALSPIEDYFVRQMAEVSVHLEAFIEANQEHAQAMDQIMEPVATAFGSRPPPPVRRVANPDITHKLKARVAIADQALGSPEAEVDLY